MYAKVSVLINIEIYWHIKSWTQSILKPAHWIYGCCVHMNFLNLLITSWLYIVCLSTGCCWEFRRRSIVLQCSPDLEWASPSQWHSQQIHYQILSEWQQWDNQHNKGHHFLYYRFEPKHCSVKYQSHSCYRSRRWPTKDVKWHHYSRKTMWVVLKYNLRSATKNE